MNSLPRFVDAKSQIFLLWLGIVMSGGFFLGMAYFMGFIPPPSPSLSAEAVAALYSENPVRFRIGVAMVIIFGGFLLPWSVVISAQLAREEKGIPVFAIMQGLGGALNTLLFFYASMFWATAAFSVNRDPQLTLLMHQLSMIAFVCPMTIIPLQGIPIVVAAFRSKTKDELELTAFPRWMGFVTLFWILIGDFGFAGIFFTSGPFTWNGLFPFWLALITVVVWLTAITSRMLHVIPLQHRG